MAVPVRSDDEQRNAEKLVELFLQCCKEFLAADADQQRRMREHGFMLDEGWNFTLPELHRFLIANVAENSAPTYDAFRRQLFNSPINMQLHELGAEIVIANNRGKVDLSTYRLQRRPIAGESP